MCAVSRIQPQINVIYHAGHFLCFNAELTAHLQIYNLMQLMTGPKYSDCLRQSKLYQSKKSQSLKPQYGLYHQLLLANLQFSRGISYQQRLSQIQFLVNARVQSGASVLQTQHAINSHLLACFPLKEKWIYPCGFVNNLTDVYPHHISSFQFFCLKYNCKDRKSLPLLAYCMFLNVTQLLLNLAFYTS